MTTVELRKGPGLPAHVHERTYEALMVVEGRLRVTLDGEEHVLARGDTASIPAGTEHAYAGDGHYTKVLTMSTPGGLERLIADARATADRGARLRRRGRRGVDLDALRAAAADLDVASPDAALRSRSQRQRSASHRSPSGGARVGAVRRRRPGSRRARPGPSGAGAPSTTKSTIPPSITDVTWSSGCSWVSHAHPGS